MSAVRAPVTRGTSGETGEEFVHNSLLLRSRRSRTARQTAGRWLMAEIAVLTTGSGAAEARCCTYVRR